MAGDEADGVKWESDGQGEFTVEPYRKADAAARMSSCICGKTRKEFLKDWTLREIVKQYSDFIDHPDRPGRRKRKRRRKDDRRRDAQ